MSKATAIPKGANSLGKSIASKLEYICSERGVDSVEAAKQCGLNPRRWANFASGEIPDPDEVERICRWAYEGVNFYHYPLSNERKFRYIERGRDWRTHKFTCNKEMDVRLRRAAGRLGMEMSSFIHMCVETFLLRENVVSTYEEAARRIERARTIQRVESDPYLQSFLSGDVDIAVEMGARLKDFKKEPRPQTHVERLFEAPAMVLGDKEWDVVE